MIVFIPISDVVEHVILGCIMISAYEFYIIMFMD